MNIMIKFCLLFVNTLETFVQILGPIRFYIIAFNIYYYATKPTVWLLDFEVARGNILEILDPKMR